MSPVIVAVLALVGVLAAAAIPTYLLNRSQRRIRDEDRKERVEREEAEKLRRKEELLAEASRRKEEADRATETAALLAAANELVATTLEKSEVRKGKAEEEVARVAAETAAAAPVETRGMLVTLVYPNGQRQDVRLIGAPREGDHIRLANGAAEPSWIVVLVMWAEAKQGREPAVVAVVRPYREADDETPVPGAGAVRTAVKVADKAAGPAGEETHA